MPKYDYKCAECDTVVEVTKSFKDSLDEDCKVCGSAMTKQFSAPSIQFNGSGFYATDNRKK